MPWAKAPSFADRPELRERLRERTEADRREQLEGGLRPVECARCGSCVLAKKNSPDHTSIQWTAAAVENCPELSARARDGSTAHVEGCPDVVAGVRAAMGGDARERPGHGENGSGDNGSGHNGRGDHGSGDDGSGETGRAEAPGRPEPHR